MADYHFVYKDVEGASTQWDDIQRRLGNLPPKPEPFKPPPFVPADDPDLAPKSKDWLDDRTPAELEDLEDDLDLDDDRFLEEYRLGFSCPQVLPLSISMLCIFGRRLIWVSSRWKPRKRRLTEMRDAAKVARFGSVMQISGSDFVREVSQAPEDVWVVVLLFKEGYVPSSKICFFFNGTTPFFYRLHVWFAFFQDYKDILGTSNRVGYPPTLCQ